MSQGMEEASGLKGARCISRRLCCSVEWRGEGKGGTEGEKRDGQGSYVPQRERQAERQTDRETDREAGRQTDREADRQRDRQRGR